QTISSRARQARAARVTGYVPSLEAFSYVPTHAEEGRQDLIGKRQIPFGFGWLEPGAMPYNELPVRVNRLAYREFSKDPALPDDEFKRRLGRDVFGPEEVPAGWVEDLLELQRAFFEGRTWCQPAPLVSPARLRIDIAAGRVSAAKRTEYRAALKALEEMTLRHASSSNPGCRDLHRIGRWVMEQWMGADLELLNAGAGS
ncbi:MAG: hypothetical protein JWO87_575, partial [Phycisphaerales bacterium]|nr:hypothetical protein [Phycisphaerales bacterium]